MNKKIKFRAKRIDNGEWAYGTYHYSNDGKYHYILNLEKFIEIDDRMKALHNIEVVDIDPKTLEQSTGLIDSSGVEKYTMEEYRSQSELPSEDVKRIANNFFQWTENLNKGDSMYSELLRCNEYNLRLQDQINSLLASRDARIKELEERPTISSNDIMIELFAMAGMKNEDGMKVIEYLDKENGGSIAYLRHDAVVKTINKLTPPKP